MSITPEGVETGWEPVPTERKRHDGEIEVTRKDRVMRSEAGELVE